MVRWLLLATTLLGPCVLLMAARHAAIHRGPAAAAAGWFTFTQRVQWITLGCLAGWAAAYSGIGHAPVSAWLAAHALSAWTGPVGLVSLTIPLVVFQAFATVLVQDVNRSVRGAEASGSEVLADSLRGLAGVGVVLLSLCCMLGALAQGHWRVAVAALLAGILGTVALGARPGRGSRFAPHAVTHGELRDRLFALAARARVVIKQLYVIPLARTRVANAVAAQGDAVMVTDYLLEHLSRDELDAVLAHELAHLRGRHPRLLGIALCAGGIGVWMVHAWSGPVGACVAVPLAILGFMALSRRLEYAADAGALQLGATPEALITGLARIARINHFPQDWSRLREWTLTHPSNARRASSIARYGGLPPERAGALLEAEAPPADRYHLPAPVDEARLFSTAFKAGILQRNVWAMLIGNAVIASTLTLVLGTLTAGGWRMLGVGVVAALACVASFWWVQHLAMRPYRSLRSIVWSRLRRSGLASGPATWVGLSPGEEARLYEGFGTWDIGFLVLEPNRLVYRGEEATFSLARGDMLAVEPGPRFPSWVPVFGVVTRWRRGDGLEDCFTLFPIEARGLIGYARASRLLQERLERWRAGHQESVGAPHSPGAASLEAAEPLAPIPVSSPPTGPVTGSAPHEAIQPGAIVITSILQLAITAAVAAIMGLDLARPRAPGVLDAMLAAVIAYLLLILPLLRARHAARPAVERETRRAA